MRRAVAVALSVAGAACGDNAGTHFDGFVQVPLVGRQGLLYTAPIALGRDTFQVQIDTGSTTSAVASSGCQACEVSPKYAAGSGAVDQHQTASQVYADTSGWSGEVIADAASIGDTPDVRLQFASITSQTAFFLGNDYQGILGLGPDDLLQAHTNSFASLTFAAGVDPVLAFELCTDSGQFFIGGFDPALADGDPVFTPMLPISGNSPYYAITVSGLGLGSASLGGSLDETILDTGTSTSLLPTASEQALVAAINADAAFQSLFGGQQIADSSCVSAAGLDAATVDAMMPPLQLSLAGAAATPVTLPATRSYLYDKGAGEFCLSFGDIGAIGGPPSGLALFGDTLLEGAVTVLDVGDKRIGFAPDVGCAAGSGAGSGSAALAPGEPPQQSPWYRPPPPALLSAASAGT